MNCSLTEFPSEERFTKTDSGLKFFPEYHDEICDILRSLLIEKKLSNDPKVLDEETSEYNCIAANQHKTVLVALKLILKFKVPEFFDEQRSILKCGHNR